MAPIIAGGGRTDSLPHSLSCTCTNRRRTQLICKSCSSSSPCDGQRYAGESKRCVCLYLIFSSFGSTTTHCTSTTPHQLNQCRKIVWVPKKKKKKKKNLALLLCVDNIPGPTDIACAADLYTQCGQFMLYGVSLPGPRAGTR